VDYINQSNPVV